MLGKKFGPARVLPILMMCFGSMTILAVAAQNFAGMMALRWFLGTLPSTSSTTKDNANLQPQEWPNPLSSLW